MTGTERRHAITAYRATLARAAQIMNEHSARCPSTAACSCPSWVQCWQRAERELADAR